MARGGTNYLPKNIYFIKKISGEYNGPYVKKPTQMCGVDDEIIKWETDKDGNYMLQSLKIIRKKKLKNIINENGV